MKEPGKTLLRRLWPLGKVALVLVVIGAALYWFLFSPTPVVPQTATQGDVVAEVMGTGSLDAHIKATVSTKIPGRLLKVLVDQGELVKADQEVARLDDHDLKHEVEIEEANVAARKAGVERLQADISYAKATLELATANQARAQRLRGTGAISQEDYDKTVEALSVARAGQSRAEAALAEGRKQLVAAEKALEFRQARLEDAVIKAPFAAIVVRRDRNAGDVVVPGSSILAVVSTEELWIGAWVDETQMARLQPGQPTRVVFRAEPERSYVGKVVRLGRETDRETREFLVDVAPEQLPKNWSVCQRAEVYIETTRKTNVTLIPASLVLWRDGSHGVFVAVDGRARWRELTLGLRGRDKIEVLSGLVSGEVVIRATDPKATLTDGGRIALP